MGGTHVRLEREHGGSEHWHRALDAHRVAKLVVAEVNADDALAAVPLRVLHAHLYYDGRERTCPRPNGVAAQDPHRDRVPVAIVVTYDTIHRVRVERQRSQIIDERQLVE